MHELNNTPKRYQNPEIFEQLAMEYTVGALQGRARDRFEGLMETHFYLKATVDAYEAKFSNLVELLPEKKPSSAVWDNIHAHIKENPVEDSSIQEVKESWWKTTFFKQGFGMAMMALVVSAAFILDPGKPTSIGDGAIASYTAAMEYHENGKPIAVTKIQKSDMKLSIDIMKPMTLKNGMQLTMWCQPKKGGKMMKMGTISETGVTELTISKEEWENLKEIGSLTVTEEMKGINVDQPTGKVMLKGQLTADEI